MTSIHGFYRLLHSEQLLFVKVSELKHNMKTIIGPTMARQGLK